MSDYKLVGQQKKSIINDSEASLKTTYSSNKIETLVPKIQNTPFTLIVDLADLQTTLNTLPKILESRVVINVRAGTIATYVTIDSFVGIKEGSLTIQGIGGVCTVRTVMINNCSLSELKVAYFTATNTTWNAFEILNNHGSNILLDNCASVAGSLPPDWLRHGVSAQYNTSIINVTNCNFNNKVNAFSAMHSEINIGSNVTGIGNATNFYAGVNGTIKISDMSMSPGSANTYQTYLTGIIILPDGTLFKHLTATDVSNPNLLINGNFDIWQRGTVQTTSGFGSDDRWENEHHGDMQKKVERMLIDSRSVIKNAKYYSRTTNINNLTGVANALLKKYNLENVLKYVGRYTLSFYMRTSIPRNCVVALSQFSGTDVIYRKDFEINTTTQWEKYEIIVDMPVVSDSVVVTDDSHVIIEFVLAVDNEHVYSVSNGISNLAGTFDLAQMKFEIGDKATPFIPKKLSEEIADCERYYEKSYDIDTPPGTAVGHGATRTTFAHTGLSYIPGFSFKTRKRNKPIVEIYSVLGTKGAVSAVGTNEIPQRLDTFGFVGEAGVQTLKLQSPLDSDHYIFYQWTAESELL